MTGRWGISIPFGGLPLADLRSVVQRLPDLGYTDAWSAESSGADAFTPLALASVWAPSLRLGTAIVPVYTRGPATLAMSVAALAHAAPGRFVLGLGASSDVIVRKWNDIAYEQPYRRVRDTVRFLRAALAGGRVEESYETFSVDGFRLGFEPAQPPPILVAALRSGMLRLAGREADGAVLNWLAPADVGMVAPFVREGGADKEIVTTIFVAPTDDADFARDLARRAIAGYLTVPVYRAFQEWLGRTELQPMWDAWEAGDRKAALAAIPDSVVDDLIVHGPPERCRERVQEYVDHGVSTPVIAVMPVGVPIARAVETLAPV
jgi:probable F420-dependent oxidoreductase